MLDLPIDPIALASKLGISVSLGHLDDGVGGLITKGAGDERPSIILNSADAPNRRRFTCAHELGHFYLNSDDQAYGYIDRRDDLSSRGEDSNERWANQFAAELLMPAVVVQKWFGEGWTLSKLAKEFGVSDIAMTYRLKNLGLA